MELQIDSSPNEANPIHIDAAYYPQGALPGDLIAIRTIKGKTRTLLFKVPAIHDTELLAKRHKAPVVVSAAAAALLGVKFGRIEVNLELVSSQSTCRTPNDQLTTWIDHCSTSCRILCFLLVPFFHFLFELANQAVQMSSYYSATPTSLDLICFDSPYP